MSKRTKTDLPVLSGELNTEFFVTSGLDFTYRGKKFVMYSVIDRMITHIKLGLMIEYEVQPKRYVAWSSIDDDDTSVKNLLSKEDAARFERQVQLMMALYGQGKHSELLALIGKIIDKLWLSPDAVAKADLAATAKELGMDQADIDRFNADMVAEGGAA